MRLSQISNGACVHRSTVLRTCWMLSRCKSGDFQGAYHTHSHSAERLARQLAALSFSKRAALKGQWAISTCSYVLSQRPLFGFVLFQLRVLLHLLIWHKHFSTHFSYYNTLAWQELHCRELAPEPVMPWLSFFAEMSGWRLDFHYLLMALNPALYEFATVHTSPFSAESN